MGFSQGAPDPMVWHPLHPPPLSGTCFLCSQTFKTDAFSDPLDIPPSCPLQLTPWGSSLPMHRGSHSPFVGERLLPSLWNRKSDTFPGKIVIEKQKNEFTLLAIFGENTLPPTQEIQKPSLPSASVTPPRGMTVPMYAMYVHYPPELTSENSVPLPNTFWNDRKDCTLIKKFSHKFNNLHRWKFYFQSLVAIPYF